MLKWPDKDPEEELDYPLSFVDWVVDPNVLDSGVGVIESATLPDGSAEETPTLSIDLVQLGTNVANFWLSGGTDGATYVIKATVTDDNVVPYDRTGVRRVKIKVKQK